MHKLTRRNFVELTATAVAATPLVSMTRAMGVSLTAQEAVDRIKKDIGVEWNSDSVDTFKAGDPSTIVTGIVTTSLASLDVLEQALKKGANLVITSEPTFYSRADKPTPPVPRRFERGANGVVVPLPPPPGPPPPDRVFTAKDDFIRKNKLAVFRLSDHWRARVPNPFSLGLANALGWSTLVAMDDPAHLKISPASLEDVVMHVKKALKSRGGMRIVGDPQLNVRKVGFLPGSTPIQSSIEMLPSVDAIVAGEVREWESVEYVLDTDALGGKKALILVGRIVSEDPGMQVCAQWLKTIVPEVASTWVSAGDPYWRPTA